MNTSSKRIPPVLPARVAWLLSCCFAPIPLATVSGGEMQVSENFGQKIIQLKHGEIEIKIAPESGANVFSIRVKGVEYLHQPESTEQLAGVSCGVPLLYPTPNRVAGGTFTFEGTTASFPMRKNAKWFIHGLVNRYSWKMERSQVEQEFVSVTCLADFSEKTELGRRYPFPHRLLLTVRVDAKGVRWHYEVDNTRGKKSVPFGFALHPYFRYQGSREACFLTIPATHWMEAVDKLPTGRIVAADAVDNPPLGNAFSLHGVDLDDVYMGMRPDSPTLLEFREVQRSVTIRASDEFTHLVVWTPERPFLGVESQTCSTDAHNLFAQGFEKESHLQICAPGGKLSGWVQYEFSDSAPE